MKHQNRTLTLWLSCCCLLVFPSRSVAQSSFFLALHDGATSGVTTDKTTASTANSEPITIPAGTHLLMKLTSALHTTSATPGAGVYLETSLPVIAGDHVLIPEHTRVLGVVERARRPGRIRGRAQIRLRFNTLILPDDHVLSIAGNLQSLPGSEEHRTVDKEGTLEPVDQIDADVYTVAGSTGVGILIGSISHIGIGVGPGAAIGLGLGLAKVLFTRGDAISLPVGTRVEIVLQRPLTVTPQPSSGAGCDTAETDTTRQPQSSQCP
jgi:hypothetical protein